MSSSVSIFCWYYIHSYTFAKYSSNIQEPCPIRVRSIGIAETFSREFLIEIGTAFGTYSLWDNRVWHHLTVGNVACILLWAVQNMLLFSQVKNFSLQLHHRYPSDTMEILASTRFPHVIHYLKMIAVQASGIDSLY